MSLPSMEYAIWCYIFLNEHALSQLKTDFIFVYVFFLTGFPKPKNLFKSAYKYCINKIILLHNT